MGGKTVVTDIWYEELVAEDAEVLGTWNSRFLKGKPAITCRKLGKGKVLHVGTWFSNPVVDLLDAYLPAPYAFPENVEVMDRIHPDGSRLRFVINHNDEVVVGDFAEESMDLLTGNTVSGSKVLEPNKVLVLK